MAKKNDEGERVNEVLVLARALPTEDLGTLANRLWDDYRDRRSAEERERAYAFAVGQKVRTTDKSRRLPKGAVGVIARINRTRIVVDFDSEHGRWNLYPSMIEPV